ncbi:TonB-dependent receptor [Pollutimonas subterranea]|uniref:TonB-dependent receptor n=1 Tax=Pollutimonas subterranea TaxID=2045210 RepID=A0A2N4U1E8_9BURK|nr:TonB-dependent receptor [Pollutimonas subterranea]PLC48830.1 TonB-dependent receptor [Pollutimonas subterranea]
MPFILNRQAFAVLTTFISATACAQSASPVYKLDQIVVTASRSAQLQKDVLGDVSVVSKDQLRKAGQDSVAEILSRQPGVQFYSNGGPQTTTGVFLRGTSPTQTLVLIDGIRINSSTQGGANWGAIDPNTIERIEIVRGAASSLYGSDAIGGVVNIITKKPDGDRPLSAWGNIGYGSYDTFKSSIGISGAQNGWDYALSSSMADSSGFNATNQNNTFSYHPDQDGYRQNSLSGSLGYTWKPGHHVGLTAYNGYMNGDYDAGEYAHPAYGITRQQAYTLTSTDDINDHWQSVLRFGMSKEYVENRAYDSHYSSLQRSYTWQNNIKLTENQQISTVLERLEERPSHSSSSYSVNRRDTNSAGLVYRGDFSAHHLQASVRNDNISGYGNQATGGLAYDYDLNDQWSMGVAGNTGFRAPTFSDLYSPYAPNPDLQPEKSRNVELNLHYQTDDTRLGLVAYQNKIRDLITLDANRNWAAYNIDSATIRGVTLTAEHDVGNTALRASADFMNPRDDASGKQLRWRARQVYRASIDHRFDAVTVGAEYQFTGKRYDDADNQISLGGYGLLGLTAGYDFSKNVGVQVRWNNILDKDYTNAYGYNMPGSNVFVNVSFRM